MTAGSLVSELGIARMFSCAGLCLVAVAGPGGGISSSSKPVLLGFTILESFDLLADVGRASGLDSWPSELEKLSDGVEDSETDAVELSIACAGTNGYTKGISIAGPVGAISASVVERVSDATAVLSSWSNEPYALGANLLKKG
ncbi:hypothetical protein E6O75_ATG06096 [Venturia nashicola]|uniref:Uncharacterized protein n=1 Tax=Venturia nashicola TaxID=86259 RepID=A0A4Z1P463_9PEZI|nr:hypothetical protein E6O75_ATG06096 [Venturia nashicola]